MKYILLVLLALAFVLDHQRKHRMIVLALLVLVISANLAHCQTLSLVTSTIARAGDTAQTCKYMHEKLYITVHSPTPVSFTAPAFKEQWSPVHSCTGIALWNGAGEAGVVAGSLFIKHLDHPKLASLPGWVSTAVSIAAIGYNIRHHHVARVETPYPYTVVRH